MAIEDLFQDGTNKVLDDRVARPLNEPTPQRSSFSIFTSVPRGGAAGLTEVGASSADTLGAYGQMQTGYGASLDPSLLFNHDEAVRIQDAGAGARARIKSGEAFSTDVGDSLRLTAKDYAPNPETSGTAENLLYGLSRFMTKAVGYTVTAGAVPGATMLAVDEGMTESDRLKQQGVDINTRTKVGTVAGGVAGVSVILPVAGATWKTTAGLVAVGGPGGFVAQQAASRSILQNAGYDQLANQYDPLDPVGLAVATLVPAAFGGYAMRGVKAQPKPSGAPAPRTLGQMGGNEKLILPHDDPRLDAYAVTAAQREGISPELLLAVKNAGEKSAPTAVSPKGAKGVMQFMDDTWAAYGKGDPRDPVASIDAGARYLKDLVEMYNGNERAALAHYNGGNKAGRAVMEGRAPPAKETRDYLARSEKYIAERAGEEAGRGAASDPEMVAAARVQQVRDTVEAMNLRDPADAAGMEAHLTAVMRAADQIGAGDRVEVNSAIPLDTAAQARLLDNMSARLEASRAELLPAAGEALDPGVVAPLRAELTALEQSRPSMDEAAVREVAKEIQARDSVSYKTALSQAKKETAAQLKDIEGQIARVRQQLETHRGAAEAQQHLARLDANIARVRADRAAVDAPTPRPGALAVRQAVADLPAPAPIRTAGEAPALKAAPASPESSPASPGANGQANPMAASVEAQAAEIARLSPDMMVQLEGMAAPMRLADALEAVKAEAAREVQEAPLLQTAAECFLRSA